MLPIFMIWLILYGSYALSRPSLPDGPGTVHAEIAREMVARHDWTTPYVNGVPIPSSFKALDWSIAASYKLFGAADWSARLPNAVCVLGVSLILFFFGRRLYGSNAAGLYAALFTLCWPGTFLATRDLTAAPMLCLETTLVAFVLWRLLTVRKPSVVIIVAITALACGLMLLTGGWSAIALPLLIATWCWLARRQPLSRQATMLLFGWAATAFFLGDLLETQRYTPLAWIGLVPPLALLLGEWLARHETAPTRAPARRTAKYIFAVGLLACAAAIFFAIHGPVLFSVSKTSVVVTTGATRIPLLIFAAAVLAGVTGNLIFRLRDRHRLANCFIAGMLAGIIVAIQAGLVIASPYRSSQILADAIRSELTPDDVVFIDGSDANASSFVFYLDRPVLLANPAPQLSSGTAAVDSVWNQNARVYLWTSSDHPLTIPGQSYVVAASGGKEILSNQPNSGGAAF